MFAYYLYPIKLTVHFIKNNFWWQNGVEAGIYTNYVSICVVKPIVDHACQKVSGYDQEIPQSHTADQPCLTKSANVPRSQWNLFHSSSNITFILLKSMVISTSGYNQFTKIYSTCVQHSMYKYEN